jgi:hypothetical protein
MKMKLLLLQNIQNGTVSDKCCSKELRAPFVKTHFIEIYIADNFGNISQL